VQPAACINVAGKLNHLRVGHAWILAYGSCLEPAGSCRI
jgi:hypothetical protein